MNQEVSKWTFFWCNLAAADFQVAGYSFREEVFKRFVDSKETIDVSKPIDGKEWKCRVYSYEADDQKFRIGYGEVSPGVYLAYADDATLPYCSPQFRWSEDKCWKKCNN
jgi:hypothetical protein